MKAEHARQPPSRASHEGQGAYQERERERYEREREREREGEREGGRGRQSVGGGGGGGGGEGHGELGKVMAHVPPGHTSWCGSGLPRHRTWSIHPNQRISNQTSAAVGEAVGKETWEEGAEEGEAGLMAEEEQEEVRSG